MIAPQPDAPATRGVPDEAGPARPRLAAVLAHAAALALLVLAVLPLPWPHGVVRELQPTPDAPEYAASGVALVRDGATTIPLAGEVHPSRYPPGYGAVIAACVALGVAPEHAPFAASAAAALLLLALVAAAAWRAGGTAASAVAVLALAAAPGFLALARAPMAETTSVAVTTAGGLLAFAWVRRPRRATAFAGGVLLGLATVVRVGNVLLWPLALGAWLAARRGGGSRRATSTDGIVWVAGLAAGVAPLAWHQWRTFGSPLANGYAYWVPDRGTFASTFGIDNVAGSVTYFGREALQLEQHATVAAFHGNGDHVGPAGLLLAAWVALVALRDARWRWAALALLAYAAAMTTYFFHDARFFAPLAPFAAIALGVAVTRSWPGTGRRGRLLLGALLALHVAAVPGSRGAPTSLALLWQPPQRRMPAHDALVRLRGEPPGAVLATCNPVLAGIVLGDAWTAAPATDDHDYRWSPKRFVFGPAERAAFVQRALAAARPVYVLAPQHFAAALAACAPPDGHRWVELWSAGDAGAARLERR